MTDHLNLATKEIESLHTFFVEWFSGKVECARDDFKTRFYDRFDESSTIIPPQGALMNISNLGEMIFAAHDSNPDFRIAIRNVKVQRNNDKLVLCTYEEWQVNALNSTPQDNARVASVLFEHRDGKLIWQHIHETWLPEEVTANGDFNF